MATREGLTLRKRLWSCKSGTPPSQASSLKTANAVLSNWGVRIQISRHLHKKTRLKAGFSIDGGEGGIRTLDTFPYTHFPGVLLRPLGHLTMFKLLPVFHLRGSTPACSLLGVNPSPCGSPSQVPALSAAKPRSLTPRHFSAYFEGRNCTQAPPKKQFSRPALKVL